MAMTDLGHIWAALGGAPAALDRVRLTGAGPGLPSAFAVGTAAQLSIAVAALAAAERFRLSGGAAQTVSVDRLAACLECRAERYARIDGRPLPELWDSIAGAYRCGDGRFVRLHTNFPHHRAGVLAVLGLADTDAIDLRKRVGAALGDWSAEDFEGAATARGLAVAMMRDDASWNAHPQAAAIASQPLITITRIGPGAARRRLPAARPLDDLRVLEMTRIIAGPVAGRTLAAHGADVLRVIGPRVPTIASLDIDTGRGKRAAHVDLTTPDGAARFAALAAHADIIVQSYRPGALDARGYSAAALAAANPGVIVGSLSAYGRLGPWGDRRGFDSLVQTTTGFNAAEAAAFGTDEPRPLPMQILDHASGHLLAAGLIAARMRQEHDGGSWHVEVSLARTGQWLRQLSAEPDGPATPEPSVDAVARHLETTASGYGPLTAVRHAGSTSATPPHYARPSVPYGTDAATWDQRR